ncbi:MAG: hypothetical protein BMS9Abin34_232 [Patescibacteria group bacterium]|nr:MAG: hypothetical protein BMS9Abin34_232 [Patescibacteria group bacterium]
MLKIKALREKEDKELGKLLAGAQSELVNLRALRVTGSQSDGSALQKKRREIARILTVLKERQILASRSDKEDIKGVKEVKNA